MPVHFLRGTAVAFAALLASLSTTAAFGANEAQKAGDLIGRWHGVTAVNSLPQPVWLTISGSQEGSFEGLTLGYESPRICQIEARYLKTDGREMQFATVSSTCAHSGGLSPVVVLRYRPHAIEYRLTRISDGGPQEVGHLARAR